MDISTHPIVICVSVMASITRLGLFFVLWNRFVPVWNEKRGKDRMKTEQDVHQNESLALFLFMVMLLIMNEFMPVNMPAFMLTLIGVVIPYVLIRRREWLIETCFCIPLFWNVSGLAYFVVNSLTNRTFEKMMEGIEQAQDINHFVEIRVTSMQIVLYFLYVFIWVLAVLPITRLVKARERIYPQELLFLTVQNVAGIVLTRIMMGIAVLPVDQGAIFLTDEKPELLWIMPVIAVLLYLGELSAIYMWQENNRNRRQSEMYISEKLEKEAMRRRLEETQDYYEKIRKVRHDMAMHLTNIKGLSEHGYEAELVDYINTLDEDIRSVEMMVSTGSPIMDMVISERCKKSQEAGINLLVQMQYDEAWGISAYDLGIIAGNLLDNAICATESVGRDREISFLVKEHMGVVLVQCTNPFISAKEETVKNEWHGLGLSNVEDIAERYDGGMKIDKGGGTFDVTVMMRKKAVKREL